MLPALPSAASLTLAQVSEFGQQIVEWAASTEDAAEVKEAANKWAAITEYIRRTSREGIAEAETALRRLEVRVGQLLGPNEPGRPDSETSVATDINRQARSDFRAMADNADIVEDVIAESDDDSPPSRRKVLGAIKERKEPRRPLTPEEQAERDRLEAEQARDDARTQHQQSLHRFVMCFAGLDTAGYAADYAANPRVPQLTADQIDGALSALTEIAKQWRN